MELENEPATASRIESDLRGILPGVSKYSDKTTLPQPSRLWPLRRVSVVAAVFLALLVAGGVWWKQRRPAESAYVVLATKQNQLSKVMLPDSSEVWVKAGSTLKYLKNFESGTRDVYLDGEAFFDVAHDASKPFVVHTADLRIKVLGTTFNVKSYPSDKTAEATLVKGKVMIEKNLAPGPGPVILAPNQRATYSREARTVTVSSVADAREIKALDLATRERESMVFDAVPFTEVLTRLENRFEVKVHIADRQGLSCLFTADFEQEGLAEIFDLIAVSHNVTYRIKGNDVYINGNICAN